ncbi:MAG: putative ferric reductase [Paracoccaceae bacterium]
MRKPTAAPKIWITGGSGITRFAAWAQALPASGPDIHLFHCVPSPDLANHHPKTTAAFAAVPNAHYHLINPPDQPRLTPAAIQQITGVDLAKSKVYFCGPTLMRKSMRDGLITLGVSTRRFHFEELEIRTGIGLRRLSAWLLALMIARANGRQQRV